MNWWNSEQRQREAPLLGARHLSEGRVWMPLKIIWKDPGLRWAIEPLTSHCGTQWILRNLSLLPHQQNTSFQLNKSKFAFRSQTLETQPIQLSSIIFCSSSLYTFKESVASTLHFLLSYTAMCSTNTFLRKIKNQTLILQIKYSWLKIVGSIRSSRC